MSTKKPLPTAEDWIIARLIHLALRSNQKAAVVDPDFVRSVLYLNKKFGLFGIGKMFDALRAEKGEVK